MSNEYIVSRIKAGLWTFSKLVFNANRDLPFHDYHLFDTGNSAGWLSYVVGHDNLSTQGDQRKLFVSKSTLVYSPLDVSIKLNNMNNVTIAILAFTWYEFKSNIFHVFVHDAELAESWIKFYFEGVMVDEARRPE